MQKIIAKWWVLISVLLLGMVYVWGVQNMYFHQDDLDWFILANRPFWEVIRAPIGDHVNYVWRVLLSLEWNTFRFNFPPYLAVSILIHGAVVGLLYKLSKLSSGRGDLGAMVALLFTINTNWTETILWISGQTITITALFVLLAMFVIWQKKREGIALLLSSWTSALAIGLLGASVLVYKKLRVITIAILVVLGLIYQMWATDGTAVAVSWDWVIKVAEVGGLMLVNSVVGRLIIPFDRYEMLRIGLVGLSMVYGLWTMRAKLVGIWRDSWSRFILLQLGIYNLIVAIGRAQYGVGIMRAERYTYLGLLLILLLFVRVMRKVELGRWVWVVPMIVILQVVGLYNRAQDYIVRPQQLKILIKEVRGFDPRVVNPEAYLPHFVLNDQRLKYGDILPLIKD